MLGNWEAEAGSHAPEHRAFARAARRRYAVNPRPGEGAIAGGEDENYFAWRWGDVLLVALDVRAYTPTCHVLDPGVPDAGGPEDFTLGAAQKKFAEETLIAHAALPYKVLLSHHTVGGNAGDAVNSAYGRGGGRAARTGEQAWLHDLMQRTGAQIFFYGHDHVFTDMVVDDIHYTLPGTSGAPWRFEKDVTGYERYATVAGYARVRVRPESLRVEFVSIEGRSFFHYEVEPRPR